MKEYIVTLIIAVKVKDESEYEAQQAVIDLVRSTLYGDVVKLCRAVPVVDEGCLA